MMQFGKAQDVVKIDPEALYECDRGVVLSGSLIDTWADYIDGKKSQLFIRVGWEGECLELRTMSGLNDLMQHFKGELRSQVIPEDEMQRMILRIARWFADKYGEAPQ